jgi:hypothetical protein
MTHVGRRRALGSWVIISFYIVFVVTCLFGFVRFRADVTRLTYYLGDLERKKTEILNERKMLHAQRAGLLSFERINRVSLGEQHEFVFPDRVKVIHVKRQTGEQPYHVSMEGKHLAEP